MLKLIIPVILLSTTVAYGYIGPGIGISGIAATLGFIVAIFAALFGILWFPIKRIIKKKNVKKNSSNDNE